MSCSSALPLLARRPRRRRSRRACSREPRRRPEPGAGRPAVDGRARDGERQTMPSVPGFAANPLVGVRGGRSRRGADRCRRVGRRRPASVSALRASASWRACSTGDVTGAQRSRLRSRSRVAAREVEDRLPEATPKTASEASHQRSSGEGVVDVTRVPAADGPRATGRSGPRGWARPERRARPGLAARLGDRRAEAPAVASSQLIGASCAVGAALIGRCGSGRDDRCGTDPPGPRAHRAAAVDRMLGVALELDRAALARAHVQAAAALHSWQVEA